MPGPGGSLPFRTLYTDRLALSRGPRRERRLLELFSVSACVRQYPRASGVYRWPRCEDDTAGQPGYT